MYVIKVAKVRTSSERDRKQKSSLSPGFLCAINTFGLILQSWTKVLVQIWTFDAFGHTLDANATCLTSPPLPTLHIMLKTSTGNVILFSTLCWLSRGDSNAFPKDITAFLQSPIQKHRIILYTTLVSQGHLPTIVVLMEIKRTRKLSKKQVGWRMEYNSRPRGVDLSPRMSVFLGKTLLSYSANPHGYVGLAALHHLRRTTPRTGHVAALVTYYYMASSVSGQDESNSALWFKSWIKSCARHFPLCPARKNSKHTSYSRCSSCRLAGQIVLIKVPN